MGNPANHHKVLTEVVAFNVALDDADLLLARTAEGNGEAGGYLRTTEIKERETLFETVTGVNARVRRYQEELAGRGRGLCAWLFVKRRSAGGNSDLIAGL